MEPRSDRVDDADPSGKSLLRILFCHHRDDNSNQKVRGPGAAAGYLADSGVMDAGREVSDIAVYLPSLGVLRDDALVPKASGRKCRKLKTDRHA